MNEAFKSHEEELVEKLEWRELEIAGGFKKFTATNVRTSLGLKGDDSDYFTEITERKGAFDKPTLVIHTKLLEFHLQEILSGEDYSSIEDGKFKAAELLIYLYERARAIAQVFDLKSVGTMEDKVQS